MTTSGTLTMPVSPTLARARAEGTLKVVVSRGILGLSQRDDQGAWHGLDTDIARAVAAAALGDPAALTWLPTDPPERLRRLASGEADIVTSNLSWTLGREASQGILFAGVTAYDGEGFLVRAADGNSFPEQLAGQRLAIQAGTTSAANLESWFGARGLSVSPVRFPDPAAALGGYASGECAAYVLDRIALAGERAALEDPAGHHILDTAISREPMALAVRDDDAGWFRVCRWVLNFLVAAEHAASEVPADRKPAASRAAARDAGRHGPALGLDADWAHRVLDAVGTYGDVYNRNLGPDSGLNVPRGLNELWSRGGLHYPFPLH